MCELSKSSGHDSKSSGHDTIPIANVTRDGCWVVESRVVFLYLLGTSVPIYSRQDPQSHPTTVAFIIPSVGITLPQWILPKVE